MGSMRRELYKLANSSLQALRSQVTTNSKKKTVCQPVVEIKQHVEIKTGYDLSGISHYLRFLKSTTA